MAVYAIVGGGFVKVGFTSVDPAERLASLQVGNPHELQLIGVSGGSLGDERAVHELLEAFRVRGEWFVDCQGSRALIERLLPRRCPDCGCKWTAPAPRYPGQPEATS